MQHSTTSPCFQATDDFDTFTAHGLLVAAHDFAADRRFFASFDQLLSVPMKKKDFSWQDKLATLWASVVVGCDHTSQIKHTLGPHERASAAVFGLQRWPDQSQINVLLNRFSPENVSQWRSLHLALMGKHSRARRRRLWPRLADSVRVLFLDNDQRGLTVCSNQFQFAAKGHFGRKRSRLGYQLSLAFFGGPIGEVLDEYLDAGNTPAGHRVEALLDAALTFCKKTGIGPDQVVVRADAQYGTVDIIEKIRARGFHFLLKGLNAQRSRRLLDRVASDSVFHAVDNGANRDPAWMCDLGELEHRSTAHGPGPKPTVAARTLVLVRHIWVSDLRRASPKERARRKAEGTDRKRVRKVDTFLTDLDPSKLPLDRVLSTYHDRSTIERYFYDEQYGLGARQVRTHHHAGEAVFEFVVATTNNLLRWMKHTVFKGTVIERLGVSRLVHVAMQIPARIKRWGDRILVELPARHHLVAELAKSWAQLLPSARDA
jgi:hypothetical protein